MDSRDLVIFLQTSFFCDLNQTFLVWSTTMPWNGKIYRENTEQQQTVALPCIENYLFHPKCDVLDIGCGVGNLTHMIHQKTELGSTIGLDPSDSMLSVARADYPEITFERGKASDIIYTNQFDLITSFSALQWEKEQKKALLAFHKALRPQGSILLAIPGPDFRLRQALANIATLPPWNSYLENFTSPGIIWEKEVYQKLLQETRFIPKRLATVQRNYQPTHSEKYRSLLRGMLPHLEVIPETKKEDYLEAVFQEVVRIIGKNPPDFSVKVLEVVAQKE